MIGPWYAFPVDSMLLEFAFSPAFSAVPGWGAGWVGDSFAYCGSVVDDSSIKVDLIRVVEHLFFRRCEPKPARLHIRGISGERTDISGRVISRGGAGTFS